MRFYLWDFWHENLMNIYGLWISVSKELELPRRKNSYHLCKSQNPLSPPVFPDMSPYFLVGRFYYKYILNSCKYQRQI